MLFRTHDRVVYPAFGIGRIVGTVEKTFVEDTPALYYEVAGERSTMWVPVHEASERGLRRLTKPEELARYRKVLSSRPTPLNPDHRQRNLELRAQLKQGTMQVYCEVVRDLTARGWNKALNEADASLRRKCWEALCEEWAAAVNSSLAEAAAEINELLRQGEADFRPA